MIHAARRPWRTNERSSGPYLERREVDVGVLDRTLLELAEAGVGRWGGRLKHFARFCEAVETHAPHTERLSDAGLRESAEKLRAPLLRNGFREDLVAQGFALVREATRRRLGMRHYPVQLMGGYALINGMLAEMQTGEGKTITAALAAVTASLAGLPVHVVTVNDYLAARDAEQLRPVYELFGMTTGIIQHGQESSERAGEYRCDVVYAANKEIAFDYLRDRLALGRRRTRTEVLVDRLRDRSGADESLLLRGLGFAIVDEADSVLVDEARTPLIISGETGGGDTETEVYAQALEIARDLMEGEDFTLEPVQHAARLTEQGKARLAHEGGLRGGMWEVQRAQEELLQHALAALHLYHRDKQYVVVEGKVQIVDEYTGRIAEGRSWEGGLHQMIEAKEGCELTGRRATRARITYQRFFRRYLTLSGMSGTAMELAGEFRAVYGLPVVRIPTNRPNRRVDRGTRMYRTAEEKWQAAAASAAAVSATGRPVLIGTRSVGDSERLSGRLAEAGLAHVVLNAHHDKEEADIVARAGEKGRITVATNMAGRGTDIRLAPGVADVGGLHVILCEFHESPRVDRQLIGRGGRQGDPSSFEAIVSLEDEVFARFGKAGSAVARSAMVGRTTAPDAVAKLLRKQAQASAERFYAAIRRHTLKSDRQFRKSLAFSGAPD